jgi:hypothetical protein
VVEGSARLRRRGSGRVSSETGRCRGRRDALVRSCRRMDRTLRLRRRDRTSSDRGRSCSRRRARKLESTARTRFFRSWRLRLRDRCCGFWVWSGRSVTRRSWFNRCLLPRDRRFGSSLLDENSQYSTPKGRETERTETYALNLQHSHQPRHTLGVFFARSRRRRVRRSSGASSHESTEHARRRLLSLSDGRLRFAIEELCEPRSSSSRSSSCRLFWVRSL